MILTKNKLEYGLPLAISFLVLVTVLQDLLASFLLDRGFYLSESLLFKIVWMLFLPSVIALWFGFKKGFLAPGTVWRNLTLAVVITGFHLLASGALIVLISNKILWLPFTFSGVEKYLIVHQGALVLLLYILILGAIAYWQREQRETLSTRESSPSYPEMISVRQGKKVIPVPVKDIHYIQSENPYNCLFTRKGKYLISKSLKQLEMELDPSIMVRVHRSTIVNIHAVKELRSRSNGDYDILLHNGDLLRWSRNYLDRRKELLHLNQ